ncbi:MAG: zinc ribbon domain-containing protein [Lachnospiraceae bacterium]
MMGLNLILICVGLIICFGGIYIRKICAGVTGFSWGILLGAVVSLMIGGIMSSIDSSSIIIILLVAIAICVVCVIYDRICTVINTFISGFFMSFLVLLLLLGSLFNSSSMSILPIIGVLALAVAGFLATIAYRFYQIAYVIVTAFSGAFIAGIGFEGFIHQASPMDVFFEIVWSGNVKVMSVLIAITIGLGIAGYKVQLKRFNISVPSQNMSINMPNFSALNLKGLFSGSINRSYGNGTSNLKDEIKENKFIFLAPIIDSIVVPAMYRILNSIQSAESIYEIVSFVSIVASGVTLAGIVYFVMTKDIKINMIYQIPYILGFLIFQPVGYINFSLMVVIYFIKYLIVWGCVYIADRLITKQEIKPLVLIVLAFFMAQYVVSWIAGQYIAFYVDMYTIVCFCIAIGAIYFIFKIYCNTNIFQFSGYIGATQQNTKTMNQRGNHSMNGSTNGGMNRQTNATPNSSSNIVAKCVKCGKVIQGNAKFCDRCGGNIQLSCSRCGNAISTGDSFCKVCGKLFKQD